MPQHEYHISDLFASESYMCVFLTLFFKKNSNPQFTNYFLKWVKIELCCVQ